MAETSNINEAASLLKGIFVNKQDTWPDDMYIMVRISTIREVLRLLGSDLAGGESNTVGARKKE